MKNSVLEAERWLKQARHDAEVAEKHLRDGYYSDAAFMAEQMSQKSLKAYLLFTGERFVPEHSLIALANKCAKTNSDFLKLMDECRLLDRLYIPTRYPDWYAPL